MEPIHCMLSFFQYDKELVSDEYMLFTISYTFMCGIYSDQFLIGVNEEIDKCRPRSFNYTMGYNTVTCPECLTEIKRRKIISCLSLEI